MRKFIVLVIALAVAWFYPKTQSLESLTGYIQNGKYELYISGQVTSEYAEGIINGGGTILRADISAAKFVYAECGNMADGETVIFEGGAEELSRLVAVLGFTTRAFYDGCYYGYSPKLGEGIISDGLMINCQIVCVGGTITVGTPVILGSYTLNT